MKIQLASDLHLEFLQSNWPGEKIIAPEPGADVLILAGDIAVGTEPFRLFANWPSQPERLPIIAVAGNHEFYGHVYAPMLEKMHEAAMLNNIHFLENESVAIGDTRFLGCILWTDYKLRADVPQQQQMYYAQRSLNDHRLIRTGRNVFIAQDALDRHMESRAWLIEELAKPWKGKTVVVTHHGPHPLSVHPRYEGDILSAAFVSDLSEILLSEHAPDLWVHGHVHDGFDYTVGKCRVVANPAGYVLNRSYASTRDDFRFENASFDPNMLLEV
jgi:Icc-related predicted phosphoesterase